MRELNGEDLSCYSIKIESVSLRRCPYDHWLTNKAHLSAITVTNISHSFTYKMAAKMNWHRYGTKLRHCHHVYRFLAILFRFSRVQLDAVFCVCWKRIYVLIVCIRKTGNWTALLQKNSITEKHICLMCVFYLSVCVLFLLVSLFTQSIELLLQMMHTMYVLGSLSFFLAD